MSKGKVIPLPLPKAGIELTPPETFDETTLFRHSDLEVLQAGEGYYRIRVGAVELTYDANCGQGAWYVYLPGHEQAELPCHTEQYDPEHQPCYINIDHDRQGTVYGIEIIK
jgi:hypothetical protein